MDPILSNPQTAKIKIKYFLLAILLIQIAHDPQNNSTQEIHPEVLKNHLNLRLDHYLTERVRNLNPN